MDLWVCHFNQYHMTLDLHGICFWIQWKSGVAKKNHRVPSDSMELGGRHFKWHRCSMEFHGIFHGIPWNSGTAKWNITYFHGIPWNIPWNSMELWCSQMKYNLVPWNSMEYSMEFHGTLVQPNEISLSSMEFHGTLRLSFYSIPCYPTLPSEIPWNSIELWDCHFNQYHVTLDLHGICLGIRWKSGVAKKNPPSFMGFHGIRRAQFQMTRVQWNSMEFHGTLAPPNEIPLSSIEFSGTLRLSFNSVPCYPAHPWEIPWNSMELWSRQIINHRVPSDSMELRGRHFKWHRCSIEFHGIFHGTLVPPKEISLSSMEFHRTLRLSFYSIPCYPGLLWEIYGIQCNSRVAK